MNIFPIKMRAKKTGLVVEFHKPSSGIVLEQGDERWSVGEYQEGFISYDNDWWEPVKPKISLPDSLFEI